MSAAMVKSGSNSLVRDRSRSDWPILRKESKKAPLRLDSGMAFERYQLSAVPARTASGHSQFRLFFTSSMPRPIRSAATWLRDMPERIFSRSDNRRVGCRGPHVGQRLALGIGDLGLQPSWCGGRRNPRSLLWPRRPAARPRPSRLPGLQRLPARPLSACPDRRRAGPAASSFSFRASSRSDRMVLRRPSSALAIWVWMPK